MGKGRQLERAKENKGGNGRQEGERVGKRGGQRKAKSCCGGANPFRPLYAVVCLCRPHRIKWRLPDNPKETKVIFKIVSSSFGNFGYVGLEPPMQRLVASNAHT